MNHWNAWVKAVFNWYRTWGPEFFFWILGTGVGKYVPYLLHSMIDDAWNCPGEKKFRLYREGKFVDGTNLKQKKPLKCFQCFWQKKKKMQITMKSVVLMLCQYDHNLSDDDWWLQHFLLKMNHILISSQNNMLYFNYSSWIHIATYCIQHSQWNRWEIEYIPS